MARFVAKGYTSTEGLRYSDLDVSTAEKQLQLAQLRLKAQQNASRPLAELDLPGAEDAKSANPDETNHQSDN